MPNTIRLRRGSGAPSAGSFVEGEPAWDSTNSRLYVKNAAASMVDVGTPANGSVTTAKLGGDITTAGKALLDDASASDQRVTLGLGMFTPAESTSAPNATVPVESWTATNAASDVDIALVAKGQGATLAQVPDSGTAGGNKRGAYATDWQKSRTAATQVASGSQSVIAGGRNNTASATDSGILAGVGNAASGGNAVIAGGGYSSANGLFSAVLGGRRGTTKGIAGMAVFPACNAPIADSNGVSQAGLLLVATQTTDATTTTLRSDTSAAGTTNQLVLANNAASYVRGSVIANVTGGGNTKAWTFEGAIKRGANAASTSIVGTFSTNVIAADAGASAWTIAISADTTNGALQIQVTGQAATTIRWVCKLETTEVTF